MKKFVVCATLVFLIGTVSFSQMKSDLKVDCNLANRITDNFISLFPDSVCYPTEAKSKRWNYEQGLVLDAFYRMYKQTHNTKYFDYMKKNMDYYVKEDGSISTYNVSELNIDNVTPGRALLQLFTETSQTKYKKAADTLRGQLKIHPRTKEGSFWHKDIYPWQVWLDGLYMGQPFYAMYAMQFNEKKSFDDITNQFILIYNHAKDPATGLLYHAWDESKEQKWCNKVTGVSPNFWGRAMGWYMMALVDVLDYIPADHPNRVKIVEIFKTLSENILKFRDVKTKLWFDIVDKQEDKRNYTEASASLMFIYAYAKGANKGYLDVKFSSIAKESFQGAIDEFVTSEDGKVFNLNKVCKVSGLGGKPYRDGSLDYYFSEPVRTNDFKGYGPFILAALEIVKGMDCTASSVGKGKTVGLDYFFNNEKKAGKRFHYNWEDEAFSGFSELGNIFKNTGADIKGIYSAPSKTVLDSLSIYFIVDPDSPVETEKPNYINSEDIENITNWVKEGGVLIIFANDSANCEFKHLNLLSEKFGIHFNEDSWNKVTANNYDMGKFDILPNHPIFKGVKKLYLKEISTLQLTKDVEPVLSGGGKACMASVNFGKGFVFAVSDPWLYNEYIDNRKLPADFTNYPAAVNLVNWLMEKSKTKK